MKKTKLEKGITLIALIITIVVLLILTVVTIGSIRESKIITHSQAASNDHIIAQEKEQIQLALGEWQIQKNIPENAQTFKSVIEAELSDSATISGNSNELTVKFNKTGNPYKISPDGAIGEPAKLTGTALEKYIFGDDLKGRELTEIYNGSEFINNSTGKDITLIFEGIEDVFGDSEYLYVIYLKYDNQTYKFKILINNEGYTTEPYYGLTQIEIDTENTKVGKQVSYDGKTWTILYDDEINGLQMISNEVVHEYNEDIFYLGYDDSSITNWNSLNTKTDNFKLADLDGNKKLEGDLEKAIYSYNNAITTLNNICLSIVTPNDNIIDVRCVGSNTTDKNAENSTLYMSDNLAKWPEGDSTYSAGIVNKKCRSTDFNYVTDLDRMVALGIHLVYDSSGDDDQYSLASRVIPDSSEDYVQFCVRFVTGGELGGDYVLRINENEADGSTGSIDFRPVVTLSSGDVLTEAGTGSTTDYILN